MIRDNAPLWSPILVATCVAIIVALAGGLLTDIGPWYQALKKPSWNPPNWLFGPVWSTIFTLAVIAAVMAWRRAPGAQDEAMIIILFGANAVFNIAWSLFFFYLRRPDWAMAEVVFLWGSVLALIIFMWRFSPVSSLLLLPYITWVSIASFLNWTILRLNGPFGPVA
jgi:translocator protein